MTSIHPSFQRVHDGYAIVGLDVGQMNVHRDHLTWIVGVNADLGFWPYEIVGMFPDATNPNQWVVMFDKRSDLRLEP